MSVVYTEGALKDLDAIARDGWLAAKGLAFRQRRFGSVM
jgi:hypothetical protein